MKIRNGFVSNSSSSSFVCDVCGAEESGMDLCLSDVDMVKCINGHIFCETEQVKSSEDVLLEDVREALRANTQTRLTRWEDFLAAGKKHQEVNDDEYKNRKEWYNNMLADEWPSWIKDEKEKLERIENMTDEELQEEKDKWDFRYECPPVCCPICTYKNVKVSDGFKFLKKKYGLTDTSILDELREKYPTYGEFTNDLEKED